MITSPNLWIWVHSSHGNLEENVDEDITCKLTANGQYSAASAYKEQFFGGNINKHEAFGLEDLGPSEANFFVWRLIFKIGFGRSVGKNRLTKLWRVPPRKRAPESIYHFLVNCCYTIRLWSFIKVCLVMHNLDFSQ